MDRQRFGADWFAQYVSNSDLAILVISVPALCFLGFGVCLGRLGPTIGQYIDDSEEELERLSLVHCKPVQSGKLGKYGILLLTLAILLLAVPLFSNVPARTAWVFWGVALVVVVILRFGQPTLSTRQLFAPRWFEVDIGGVHRIDFDIAPHRKKRIYLDGECVFETFFLKPNPYPFYGVELDIEDRVVLIEWTMSVVPPPQGRVFIDGELYIPELFPLDEVVEELPA